MDVRRRGAVRILVVLSDALLVAGAMFAAFGAHAALRPYVARMRHPPALDQYAAVAYLALPLWLLLIIASGLDRVFDRPWARWELAAKLARMHALGSVGLLLVLFITQSTLNRTIVVVFVTASFVLLYAERLVLGAYGRHQLRSGLGTTRLVLVAAPSQALEQFVARSRLAAVPPKFVGRLGTPSDVPDDGAPYMGPPEAIADVLGSQAVDEVIFFPPYDDPRRMRDALEACTTVGVPASFALDTQPLGGVTPLVRREHETALLTFEVAAKSPFALVLKHALDAIAAATLLLALAPLLLVVSLLILVTMGRPVFFTQRRAGLRGREFSMLKFRTMIKDAEAKKAALLERNEMSGPTFKLTDDPRVTRLGRFLRKSSIDELPQLVHVLTGAMSLVGPRPLPVQEQEKIQGWHRRRLSMKPGLTCLWQIGGRSNIDFEGWMALDLRYVDEWSLWLDLKILLSTIPVVLVGRGAR